MSFAANHVTSGVGSKNTRAIGEVRMTNNVEIHQMFVELEFDGGFAVAIQREKVRAAAYGSVVMEFLRGDLELVRLVNSKLERQVFNAVLGTIQHNMIIMNFDSMLANADSRCLDVGVQIVAKSCAHMEIKTVVVEVV